MDLIHKISVVFKEFVASLDHASYRHGTSISLLPDMVDFCHGLMDGGPSSNLRFAVLLLMYLKTSPFVGRISSLNSKTSMFDSCLL